MYCSNIDFGQTSRPFLSQCALFLADCGYANTWGITTGITALFWYSLSASATRFSLFLNILSIEIFLSGEASATFDNSFLFGAGSNRFSEIVGRRSSFYIRTNNSTTWDFIPYIFCLINIWLTYLNFRRINCLRFNLK